MAQRVHPTFTLTLTTSAQRIPVPKALSPEDLVNLMVLSSSAPFDLITDPDAPSGLTIPTTTSPFKAGTWRVSGAELFARTRSGTSTAEFVFVDDPGIPR